MKSNYRWGRLAAVAAVLLVVGAGAAMAQLQTGNLYGKVSDQTGAALPGVTVTLDTGEAPQVQVTNAQGDFRFLSLAPATYKIKAELQGFSPVEYPRIVINVGRNTNIEVTMNSAVEDVITVTSESPLLDEKAIRTGTTVSQTELQKIPTSRDPWTVLQTAPGVLMDRVNVGGNNSGQQSLYTGPGSFSGQAVWSVDGVVITDMSALGSSPGYYDFDAFEEMQVSTGGSDTTIATGGVVLNMVTKRGTNEYRGSARYLQVPGSTQSTTSLKQSDLPPAQVAFNQAHGLPTTFSNGIKKVQDYGAEIGGPILKDHLWLWGSYGRDEIHNLTVPTPNFPGGQPDNTKLPAWNAKMNAQITSSNSATFVGFNSSKQKQGRNAGPSRPPETTWNQGAFGGSPTLLKAEDTQIFSPNLYLTLLYSHVYGGFFLDPQSGLGASVPAALFDDTATWHNSFADAQIKRPQHQEKADASTFFNTGGLSHELKYGASYRVATSITSSNWQGGGYIDTPGVAPVTPPPGENFVYLSRQAFPGVKTKYTSAYVQDTLTTGNLTVNLGLRYDRQGGDNLPLTVPANPVRPDLLPPVAFAGSPIGFTWKTWAPRVGLTYALGKDRSTLLRASYSRFADQLGAGPTQAQILNPLSSISYYYAFTTNPGNGHLTAGQIVPAGLGYSANVDPNNPAHLLVANGVSKSLNAPTTDEFLISAEHALLPEFVVGVNLTYRKQRSLLQEDLLVFDHNTDPNSIGRVSTRADYVPVTLPVTLPNGSHTTVTYYKLAPGISTKLGYLLRNGDYQDEYKGASLTLNKRLANRWMFRGNFSFSNWKYNKAGDRPDPTVLLAGGTTDGNYVRQGDVVLQASGAGSGSFANVYINAKWSFNFNGLYQIAPDRPWGFNVAGNLTGRQGYPNPPWFQLAPFRVPASLGADKIQIGSSDANRVDNIVDFDARIEKEFTFQDFGLTLGVDCFNVFNEAYILQRRGRLSNPTTIGGVRQIVPLSNSDFVFETLSPRIFRFGARLSFK
jgi:hypothetical protein